MNRHIKISALLSLCLAVAMASCDDMNSIHQKYLDRGEEIYLGVADSLKSLAGDEKIRLMWELNSDPRITKTVIYWNKRADSVVVPVERNSGGIIKMSRDIDLPEGSYTFEFITRDDDGNFSMWKEISAYVYGRNYAGRLTNRVISSFEWLRNGDVLLNWAIVPYDNVQYTMVEVVDGDETVRVENDDTSTTLTTVQEGQSVKVTTYYLPENALGVLGTVPREYQLPERPRFEMAIPKPFAMITPAIPGDNTTVNNNRPLSNIWDGTSGVILHTATIASFPQFFTFDLKIPAYIYRLRLWPRVDSGTSAWEGNSGQGNSPKKFEVWGTDVLKSDTDFADDAMKTAYWTVNDESGWKGDWTMLADCDATDRQNDQTAWNTPAWADGWEFPVIETVQNLKVQYIRLVINENWRPANSVNIGEITLWGDDMVQ